MYDGEVLYLKRVFVMNLKTMSVLTVFLMNLKSVKPYICKKLYVGVFYFIFGWNLGSTGVTP